MTPPPLDLWSGKNKCLPRQMPTAGGGVQSDVASVPRPPAVGDRITPVAAKPPAGDAHPDGGLAALVFVEVHQTDHPVDILPGKAGGDDGLGTLILLDVEFEDAVEHLVGGQVVLILLVGGKFGGGRAGDHRLGDHRGETVAVAAEGEYQGL